MIDLWNPDTYKAELERTLSAKSQLIFDYYSEAHRLMDEHLNSSPYQSLKPNRFSADFLSFQEYGADTDIGWVSNASLALRQIVGP